MTKNRPSNIREFVWKQLDTDLALRKDLSRGLINMRALAGYIISEHSLDASIDSVISAIRRYNLTPGKKIEPSRVQSMLKQAKISTVTKIASLTLKKTEHVHEKIAQVLPGVDYSAGEIFRVVEGSRIFKVLFDRKDFNRMSDLFHKQNIIGSNMKLGMVELIYPPMLERVPGVFSTISNELAENDISIVDALICGNEHIIIVDEKDVLKAFDVIFRLCS